MHHTVHLSPFGYSNIVVIRPIACNGMGIGGNGTRDVRKMGMRYRTVDGMGMGMILRELEGTGTTI